MPRAKGRRGKGSSREKKKPASPKKLTQRAAPYEYLDHPADVGFIARGKTLEELFAQAALALCNYGWDLSKVRARESVTVRVRAATLEDLLFSWLSEILYLTDAEKRVFKHFKVEAVEETKETRSLTAEVRTLWEIRGEARGERFLKSRHRTRTYIKAVTYHQLEVKPAAAGWPRRRRGWQATVYIDV